MKGGDNIIGDKNIAGDRIIAGDKIIAGHRRAQIQTVWAPRAFMHRHNKPPLKIVFSSTRLWGSMGFKPPKEGVYSPEGSFCMCVWHRAERFVFKHEGGQLHPLQSCFSKPGFGKACAAAFS